MTDDVRAATPDFQFCSTCGGLKIACYHGLAGIIPEGHVTIDAELLDDLVMTITLESNHTDPHVEAHCFKCQLLARVKAERMVQ